MKPFRIYTLVDPRDRRVRYVGCTVNTKARLAAHMSNSEGKRKRHWIRELVALGLSPEMKVVSTVLTSEEAATEEIRVYDSFDQSDLLCDDPRNCRYIKQPMSDEDLMIMKQVRIDQDTYTKAQKKAKAMGLNFSAYVRYLIIKDLGD